MICRDQWWGQSCLTCLVVNVGCVSYDRRLLNFWECFLFLQLLTGTVSSLEDHGYLVDIGVSGARAFLPLQKAQEYIRQKNKGEGKEKDECVVVRWSVWGLCLNATVSVSVECQAY